jgi:DNA polymerase-4
MRKPEEVERLYLDFDGFFAAVEQTANPALRGRPIGVVPFAGTDRTCVIACSREAKLRGVRNVMAIEDARKQCPDIVLVPQSPDLYRRAHNALVSEIECVLPIDAVKSIDEITCRVDRMDRADPKMLGIKIKKQIRVSLGDCITASIGFAANRQLAKMACKAGKWHDGLYGDGLNVWQPPDMPAPLFKLQLDDVPGIGRRLKGRLMNAGIGDMAQLLATQPKQMRKLWGNVTGERLWYALHGYDIQTPKQGRSMYGHGRVLPPDHRSLDQAREASRLLLVKAARRLRREGWNAGRVSLWLSLHGDGWARDHWLPDTHDDRTALTAIEELWSEARQELHRRTRVIQVHVALYDLSPVSERQLDLLLEDDTSHSRWEKLTTSIDALNAKHGRTLVSFGRWSPPPGGYAGGKISYTRVPSAEDFW